MFVLLVILYVLVFCVLFEVIRIASYLSVSKRLTNSIKKFERHNPAATTKILFIGDSTGHGTGASHERYSIVGRIGADFPDAHIENSSKSGRSLSKVNQLFRARIRTNDSTRFDVIIIMIGGINLVRCTPMRLVRSMLQSAITYSKQFGRKIIIISPNNAGLASLFRFPLSRLYQKRARQFDAVYRDIAHKEHIHHVSLFNEYSDPLSVGNLFAPDKTHPNDDGYSIWYNQMKEIIRRILKNHD